MFGRREDVQVPVLLLAVLEVEVTLPVNRVTLEEALLERRVEDAVGMVRELKREFVVVAPAEVVTV
jgi:hypothetical protein